MTAFPVASALTRRATGLAPLTKSVTGTFSGLATFLSCAVKVTAWPVFVEIVQWARRHHVAVNIVSDSFQPLISHVLKSNGIDVDIPIFANEVTFAGDGRLVPHFPHYDPAFVRSANAKARHLEPYKLNKIIFAGDGHSDFDAALAADVVFAKASLAKELDALGTTFFPFETLEPVLAYLETTETAVVAPVLSLVGR